MGQGGAQDGIRLARPLSQPAARPSANAPSASAAPAFAPSASARFANARLASARPANLRLRTRGEPPAPTMRRLAGMCAWSALLGFLGVAVGIRGAVAMLGTVPDWYQSTLIGLGLGGIFLTVVAFLTVQYRTVPFVFLSLASGTLHTAIIATGQIS